MIQNEGKHVIIKENNTKDIFLFGIYGVRDVLFILFGTVFVIAGLWYTTFNAMIVFQFGLYTLFILCVMRYVIPEFGLMLQSIIFKEIRYIFGIRHFVFKETHRYKN